MVMEELSQYNLFTLSGQKLGINVSCIDFISMDGRVMTIPLAEDTIEGVMDIRGEIITVINLARRLNIPEGDNVETPAYIIVTTHESDERIALKIDEILDNVYADKDEFTPPPANLNGISAKHVQMIHRRDGELIPILNVENILGET
jgi:purine-binding chemotaxis protein CheW